ncbi:MAG TPA: ribulose-phosphate 3-epimerase [Candidatus Gracilibacteria bacterium]
MQIAPSILDADFSSLQAEIDSLQEADRIHLDIMDGQYVPAVSFDVQDLVGITFPVPIEAHLMVDNPESFFERFITLGCSGIAFHIENTGEATALELLTILKNENIRAGICVDGYTDTDELSDEILEIADQVLLMSVKAGAGGQSFMMEVLDKIESLRARGFGGEIEVDGGVTLENAESLKEAGADIVVVGSALMKRTLPADRAGYIEEMQGI